jgi:spore coat polysaccharide biosynthesis protein SpsF (cytidylyltransferase family)
VDTDDDFKLIEKIIQKIDTRPIHLIDVLKLFQNESSLFEMNNHVKHDGYKKSLKEDEEFLKNTNDHEKNN